MTYFIDFVLASGAQRVSKLAAAKKRQHSTVLDFYRPLRTRIVTAWSHGAHRGKALEGLLQETANPTATKSFKPNIDGHQRFVAQHPGLSWFEPVTGILPAGPKLGIAINPELGLVIDGVPHHLKLWLRNETLVRQRVAFTIALMSRLRIPEGHRFALLDLRRSALCYLDESSSQPMAWRKLGLLIDIEATAYAKGWELV